MPFITLLSDYGLENSYVAEVKGVIYQITPDATIIDISHDVGNHRIREGAYRLARSVMSFPKGTINIGLINSDYVPNRSIIIQSKNAFFVGPDNGLLAPASERLGIEKIFEITESTLLPPNESDTFIGRDVLAPAAALLAKGVPPSQLGIEVSEYIRLPDFDVEVDENRIEARVIHVDEFGNLVTNITSEILKKIGAKEGCIFAVEIQGKELLAPYVRRYSAVEKGSLLACLAGGYLELAINLDNACKSLGYKIGEKITLTCKKWNSNPNRTQ